MNRQVGNTVARVRGLDTIRNFITRSALTLVIDLFFTIVFFAVLYLYSPTLTWVVLGSISFYIVLSISITPVLRRRLDKQFKRGAENQASLTESMYGIETVKVMANDVSIGQLIAFNMIAGRISGPILKLVPLSPGMTVTAEVKTGQRRVIEFFLSPLLRYKSESLGER